MRQPKIVKQAIRAAGSGAALGKALGLTRQAIYQWERIPVEHVLLIERLTGLPRHQQRPDIYPDPAAEVECTAS
jgi:DNA-binding transcriptional regulator YdaS (Cro superfamily)